jgi:predicted ATPase/DNA-binding SARP family transcriptional activator/Tfp pilus assembly protein PilF
VLQIRYLGPLEVSREGEPVALGGPKERGLLLRLALSPNRGVSDDQLVDAVWGEEPPAAAIKVLQNCVLRLRKAVGGDVIVRRSGAYEIVVDDDTIDALVVETLRRDARDAAAAGNHQKTATLCAEALAMWRGPAVPELAGMAFASAEAGRLHELFLWFTEARIDAELAVGHHGELVADLAALSAAEPRREGFWAQRLLALYRSGRQAEALRVYQDLRATLGEELGLEPSTELAELERAIATQSPELARSAVMMPSATPSAIHNLPAEHTTFVGRESELHEVTALLAADALVTVVGPGGVGKTRLLLESASRQVPDFTDGCWFSALGPVHDPQLVPAVVASALGLTEQPRRSIADTLVERLALSHALLVIDNCEHVIEAVAALVDDVLSSCPNVRILASSREPLGLRAEAVLQLRPLELPSHPSADLEAISEFDAVALFVERASKARAEFALSEANAADVVRICRSLDGLPLAIELVATLVRQLTVAELGRRLESHLRLPSVGRGREPRHASVQAAIDWSYQLLTEDERLVFDRLTVFAGGFTMDAAEAVLAGLVGSDVIERAGALVDKSLVVFEDGGRRGRYRMLETIRRYGADRLDELPDAGAVRDSHLRWYVDLAERFAAQQDSSARTGLLDELEVEEDNVRAALVFAETVADGDVLSPLAVTLLPFWRIRGHFAEGRRWLAVASVRSADPQVRAEALSGEGSLALLQGDYRDARRVLEHALELFRDLGDDAGAARSLHALGQVASYQGDRRASRARFEEALEAFAPVDDAGGVAAVRHDLGRLASHQGDYAAAEASLSEALSAFRALGDIRGTADALHDLGRVATRRRDHGVARANLQDALALYSDVGDRRGIAASSYALGRLAFQCDDFDEARASFTDSVDRFRILGDPHGAAWPLHGLGLLAEREGDTALAAATFEEVLAIGRSLDSGPLVMTAVLALGDLSESAGDVAGARSLLEQALDVATEMGYAPDVAHVHERLRELSSSEPPVD